MAFADLELSRHLERAEGRSCLEFAEARGCLDPQSGPTWIECAGAYAVFDGVNSPVTQSFGLGLFEPLSFAALGKMEAFFLDRGAIVLHEVSPPRRHRNAGLAVHPPLPAGRPERSASPAGGETSQEQPS